MEIDVPNQSGHAREKQQLYPLIRYFSSKLLKTLLKPVEDGRSGRIFVALRAAFSLVYGGTHFTSGFQPLKLSKNLCGT
jgi:hypothetical protein